MTNLQHTPIPSKTKGSNESEFQQPPLPPEPPQPPLRTPTTGAPNSNPQSAKTVTSTLDKPLPPGSKDMDPKPRLELVKLNNQFHDYIAQTLSNTTFDINEIKVQTFMELTVRFLSQFKIELEDNTGGIIPEMVKVVEAYDVVKNELFGAIRRQHNKTPFTDEYFLWVEIFLEKLQESKKWQEKCKGWQKIHALCYKDPGTETILTDFYRYVKEAIVPNLEKRKEQAKKLEEDLYSKVQKTSSTPFHKDKGQSLQMSFRQLEDEELLDEPTQNCDWEEPEADPKPGATFDDRKKDEPTLSHFQTVMHKFKPITTEFFEVYKTLEKEMKVPALADPEIVRGDLKRLTRAYVKLRDARMEATKYFNYYTKCADTFLNDRLNLMSDMKEYCDKFLFCAAVPQRIEETCSCPICGERGIKKRNFDQHIAMCRLRSGLGGESDSQDEEEDDLLELNQQNARRSPPLLDRRSPPLLDRNLRSPSIGPSISRRGSSHSSRSSRSSRSGSLRELTKAMVSVAENQRKLQEDNHRFEQRRWNQAMEYQERMARANAEHNLRPEEYCHVFDPDKINKKQIFKEFSNWDMEFRQLMKVMNTLQLDEERKYHYLKGRLGESAWRLISEDNPDRNSFTRGLEKLKNQYYSKALASRDLYNRMKTLQNMNATSPQQIMDFATAANSLITEFIEKDLPKEDLQFLLVSELVVPKLNKRTSDRWATDCMKNENVDDSLPLGHKLKIADLKNLISDAAKSAQHHEFSKLYNTTSEKTPEEQPQSKKNDKKKKGKKEEEEQKYFPYSNQTQTSGAKAKADPVNKMPQLKNGMCPVPKCKSSMDPEKGGHEFILNCKTLKEELTATERIELFKKWKSSCAVCFSISHKYQKCPLVCMGYAEPCKKWIGPSEKCGKWHNWLLCDAKTYKRKNPFRGRRSPSNNDDNSPPGNGPPNTQEEAQAQTNEQ